MNWIDLIFGCVAAFLFGFAVAMRVIDGRRAQRQRQRLERFALLCGVTVRRDDTDEEIRRRRHESMTMAPVTNVIGRSRGDA